MKQEITTEMTNPDAFGHMLNELIDDADSYHNDRYNGEFYIKKLIDASFVIQYEIKNVYEDLMRQMKQKKNEEINAELRVPFFEFEQAINIDARMEENIKSVIDACDRVVHERSTN